MAESQRVVVTGLGPVSAVGIGLNEFWTSLVDGKTGIDRISGFDPEPFACQIGAEIKGFDPKTYFKDKKSALRNDRYTQLGVAASKLAMEDAGLDASGLRPERFGVIMGTAFGGLGTLETQIREMDKGGPAKVSPFAVPMLLGNTISGIIAIELGALGPNYAVLSACAAATHAMGVAYKTIKSGEADVIISGGSEAAMTPFGFAGFCSLKAMATKFNDSPAKGSRPFDKDRGGFVMGEGAGALVLESYEHAKQRGARIYAELAGFGASCDAHHITTPHPEGAGLAAALEAALSSGGVRKEEVTYINAHGTSTAYNDKFETMAIKRVFGDDLASKLYVSSTKGATGHTLGAAGGLEAIAAVQAIATKTLPPTINLQTPDPDCDLNYVPNKAVTLPEVKATISQNLGFGGHNGVVVFRPI